MNNLTVFAFKAYCWPSKGVHASGVINWSALMHMTKTSIKHLGELLLFVLLVWMLLRAFFAVFPHFFLEKCHLWKFVTIPFSPCLLSFQGKKMLCPLCIFPCLFVIIPKQGNVSRPHVARPFLHIKLKLRIAIFPLSLLKLENSLKLLFSLVESSVS